MPQLKGQDTTIKFIVDGKVEAELGHIVSFNETIDRELLEDDFLGETATDYDHVNKGFKISFTAQEDTERHREIQNGITKAMRYLSGGIAKVDILRIVRFPRTGKIFKTTYLDVKFGPCTINTSSRTDRVTLEVECGCKERTPEA